MTVPLKLLFALFIAYLLNFKIKGINLFRTAYYIPSILGGSVAIAVLWQFLFQNEGLVNTIIGLFGVKPVNWLGSPDYALFVICLLRVWQFGSAMVIFLAALKGVPQDLYEAASIDGAGAFQKFLYVTLPGLKNVIKYVVMITMIQAMKLFTQPYVMTQGGPQNSTRTLVYYIYEQGFQSRNFGYACSVATVFFVIVVTMSLMLKRVIKAD